MSSTPYIKLMKSERRKERIFERVRRRARECFYHYALCGLVFGMINRRLQAAFFIALFSVGSSPATIE